MVAVGVFIISPSLTQGSDKFLSPAWVRELAWVLTWTFSW